jgi:hypothetical protein
MHPYPGIQVQVLSLGGTTITSGYTVRCVLALPCRYYPLWDIGSVQTTPLSLCWQVLDSTDELPPVRHLHRQRGRLRRSDSLQCPEPPTDGNVHINMDFRQKFVSMLVKPFSTRLISFQERNERRRSHHRVRVGNELKSCCEPAGRLLSHSCLLHRRYVSRFIEISVRKCASLLISDKHRSGHDHPRCFYSSCQCSWSWRNYESDRIG